MNDILKMLTELKNIKISTSTVEKEIGVSNGLLGKAAKGISNLSAEKMENLIKYYDLKTIGAALKSNMPGIEYKKGTDVSFDGGKINIQELDEVNCWKEEPPIAGEAVTIRLSKTDHCPPSETSIKVRPLLPWMKAIEDYCQEKEIVPEDLILYHKHTPELIKEMSDKIEKLSKKPNTVSRTTTEVDRQSNPPQLSNFIKEQQKKKNGMS